MGVSNWVCKRLLERAIEVTCEVVLRMPALNVEKRFKEYSKAQRISSRD